MHVSHTVHFKRALTGSVACIVALALAGCAAVGPDYVEPNSPAAATWHSPLDNGLVAREIPPETLSSWWTQFNDAILTTLVQRAVAGNLDVQTAEMRIREARAARGMAKAALFPTLNASGSSTWTRSGGEMGTGETSERHSAAFDAGWELDLFGGTRRSIEAKEADLQATEEALHDTLVSLVAEVALNYVEIRTYQRQLAAVEGNLEAQQETYQLTAWQYEGGLRDELDVQQARYNLESTRSQLPTLRSGLSEAMNRMAVLLGEQPGALHAMLAESAPIPVGPEEVAVGVPADTLRQRPDVRQAERQLAAQTARVGVATADLYPKFALNGSLGLGATTLVSGTSSTLSGGPQATWAIFDGGAIRQNIEMQSAIEQQYLLQYEATILSALEEVENAMVSYAQEQNRREALEKGTVAAQAAAELAEYQYQAGLADFTTVLEAQRSLLAFQSDLASSNGTVTSNVIRLYKALGGGWTTSVSN